MRENFRNNRRGGVFGYGIGNDIGSSFISTGIPSDDLSGERICLREKGNPVIEREGIPAIGFNAFAIDQEFDIFYLNVIGHDTTDAEN